MDVCRSVGWIARPGDLAVIMLGKRTITVYLKHGEKIQTHDGEFEHSDIIGRPWGRKVWSHNERAYSRPLPCTPELWTQLLPHRTQIMYTPDISMVLMQLNVRSGSIVIESGAHASPPCLHAPLLADHDQ